jgi:ribosome-binding protein aMBF1 (putative translation factor)
MAVRSKAVKLSDLKTHQEVVADRLRDPEYRAVRYRTALAHAVALKVTQYRADQDLSQRALAQRLGMKQPAIARLEAGDVTPSVGTLVRLSRNLGLEFHMDITPDGVRLSA